MALLRRRTTAMDYHQRGWALSERGQHAAALDAFRQAIALDPAMTYAQYKIALELSLLGRDAEALAAADAAVEMMGGDTAPQILRGAILFQLERYPEALDALTAVAAREPDNGQVHFDRAVVLRALGRYDEALAGFDEALRLAPGLTVAREQREATVSLARKAR
jgi:tetratricopeptide (TPR) repeat protein